MRVKELLATRRRLLTLPMDVQQGGYSLWIRVPDPKTKFRGPRRQVARSDEALVVRLATEIFGADAADSFLWGASEYTFRKRWSSIGMALRVPVGGHSASHQPP